MITLPVVLILVVLGVVLCAQKDVGGSGTPPIIAMIATFALVIRNNPLLALATGLSFERALWYHKIFGLVATVVTGLHGLAYLLDDASDSSSRRRRLHHHEGHDAGSDDDSKATTALTGAIAFFLMCALVIFSFGPIRRRCFELFVRVHLLLFVLVVVFCVIHGAAAVLIGFVPLLLDVLFRYGLRMRGYSAVGGAIHESLVSVVRRPGNVLQIQFPRMRQDPQGPWSIFTYEAGQYVFLCVPGVSALEWHPFSIASAPHEASVTIYVKISGDWTEKLAALASAEDASHPSLPSSPIAVLVDGPYGSVAINAREYSHIAFISGGVGITPMLSLARLLHHEAIDVNDSRTTLQCARFVWPGRDKALLESMLFTAGDGEGDSGEAPSSLTSWLRRVTSDQPEVSEPFQANFYLTKDTQEPSSLLQQRLGPCLSYGQRPDIAGILRELGENANAAGAKRVGVLVCGPAALTVDVVQRSQHVANALALAFDVHTEVFAF